MKILYSNQANFKDEFNSLVNRSNMDIQSVMPIVNGIINEIKTHGDEALKAQIAKFDKWEVKDNLAISTDEMKSAYEALDSELKNALEVAYKRIKSYHEKQVEK